MSEGSSSVLLCRSIKNQDYFEQHLRSN